MQNIYIIILLNYIDTWVGTFEDIKYDIIKFFSMLEVPIDYYILLHILWKIKLI